MVLEFPSSDESHHRLKTAGWSVGFVSYGHGWQVDGRNGENRIEAYGLTLAEPYRQACQQAQTAGMLTWRETAKEDQDEMIE